VIPLPQPEVAKWKSLALAATVHLLLIAALFFGVQWKSQAPTSVEVEVWRAAPAPSPMPVVKPEPAPEPKPEPKPTPKPEPRVEPKPPVKADIVVKEEKKPKELPKKEEPKKPEPKKEEPKREEPDWKKELAREQKQLDQQKTVQDQRARAATEASQLNQLKAEQVSAARNRGMATYAGKVRDKIRGNIVLPQGIQGNPLAEFEVTQLPSGEVLGVKVRKSSGNQTLDAAIERAILKSSPLPKPDQPELFERTLKIPYKPFEE
jgi:colicin import membrane protein